MRAPGSVRRSRRVEWLARVGLALFGFALALLLLEAGLQVAGSVLRAASGRPAPESWAAGSVRVLCLGDSSTFGLHLKPEEAYPAQLELLWNETMPSRKLEVVNLGYPGTNTTRLIRDLDRTVGALVPDLVLLMIGVNDFWTERFADEGGEGPGLWRRSRLYRLARLMGRGAVGEVEYVLDPERKITGTRDRLRIGGEEFHVGFKMGPSLAHRNPVEKDLRRLVERIGASGVDLYLMTYPARTELYAQVNPVIRDVAASSRTKLIDLEAAFAPRCADDRCPDLIFRDNHPTQAGYRLIAETIAARLAAD